MKNNITVITTVTTINNQTGETKTTASIDTQPALTYIVAGKLARKLFLGLA